MPDGNIIVTGNRARKHSVGYDLNSLFIGAEGTLGVVVEAVLRLEPVLKLLVPPTLTLKTWKMP